MSSLDEACEAVAAYQRRKRQTVERMAAVLLVTKTLRAYREDRVSAYRANGIEESAIKAWDHHAIQLAADLIEKVGMAA